MSVVTDTLEHVGGFVSEYELAYQLHKRHGLAMSLDEIGNACRALELAGQVEVRTSYRRVSEDA